MRITLSLLLTLLVCGSLVLGQGAGPAGTKGTKAQEVLDQAYAGPGYVQKDFLSGLQSGLVEEFGDERGTQMVNNLKGQGLSDKDMLDLMNGKVEKSSLQNMFGASRGELQGLEEVLGDQVQGKDRKMFFGIMIVIIIIDFDLDPTSEFCKQACGAQGAMGEEAFKKLMQGNVSTNTIEDAFGFGDKEDQKFMQQILNMLMQSPMLCHPMCQSMGLGDSTKFDPEQFPKLGEGMPGFGGEFGGGMAGGMPFDQRMPPCPFFRANLGQFFGDEEGGGTPAAPVPSGERPATTDE